MPTLDHTGKACPIPVIETKRALEGAAPGSAFEVIVDNATAVENLAKFAEQRGYAFARGAESPGRFVVTVTSSNPTGPDAPGPDAPAPDAAATLAPADPQRGAGTVVAVGARTMGEGDERLGATLLTGFLYALTELTTRPDAIVFYNGGAHLTAAGSASLDDLRRLEAEGVEVLTCGTCINHYGLAPTPEVGGVTNMYAIVEWLTGAARVVKP